MALRDPDSRRRRIGRGNVARGVHGDIVETLGVQIVGGGWKPGESLPTEAELMEDLQVSRTVIREALRVLRAKGLVESRPMAGAHVRPRSNWRLLDPDVLQWRINSDDREALLRDLMEVRLIFEPAAARSATLKADDEARAKVRDVWERMRSARDLETFIDVDIDLHAAILSAAGNEILEQLFAVIEAAQRLLLDLQMRAAKTLVEKPQLARTLKMHGRVVDAFLSGQADLAETAMRTLIENAVKDAEKGLRSLGSGDDKPREWMRHG
ncbi:MAG: FadR/GntR family transcriptional regulator [Pseudomonadota bacterium]